MVVPLTVGLAGFLLGSMMPMPAAAMLVPGAPNAVTISHYGPAPFGPGADLNTWEPDRVVTLKDRSEVGRITADVNRLPLFPRGTYNCPQDDGSHYLLKFIFTNGDSRTVFADIQGCEGVGFQDQPDNSIAWSMTDHRLLDEVDALFR